LLIFQLNSVSLVEIQKKNIKQSTIIKQIDKNGNYEYKANVHTVSKTSHVYILD